MTVQEQIHIYVEDFKDYKFIRSYLKTLDYSTLSDSDKFIVCQYMATDIEECKIILGDEYNAIRTDWGIKSNQCRAYRWECAFTILQNSVDEVSLMYISGSISQLNLKDMYIQGYEGKCEGDLVASLFDWVQSLFDFLENGLSELPLTMLNGKTKPELVTELMDCIKNGNY